KVTAQRAENIQKKYKKDNFYIISIEIVFFHLSRYFMSRTLFICIKGSGIEFFLNSLSLSQLALLVEFL
ncbi:hypothetical protein GNX60_11860, partial [Staphylococcus sp. 170179]|uniref:hypothetical protein n=1 Tax=Staphylococcus borealis TaxID=2742203 RepID=UPI0012E21CCB